MNKFKKVAIILIATMCLACNNVFAETKEINTATRVRKEASTESGIVTVLYPGNDVEVLSKDGEWSKIKRGEFTGYVKTEFLKELEDKDEEIETANKVKNETKNEVKNEVKNTVKTENKVSNTAINNTVTNNNNVKNEVTSTESIIADTLQTLPEGKIAILIKTDLNLLPNFFSNSIIELDAGTELDIVDEINNWYKVTTKDGKEGWVLKSKTTNKVLSSEPVENKPVENVQDSKVEDKKEETKNTETDRKENSTSTSSVNKKGVVNVETANVRKSASTSSDKVGFLDYDDIVTIVSEENDFYKIKTDNLEGYVSKKLITIDDEKVSSRSLAEERKEEVLKKEAERKEQEEQKENNVETVNPEVKEEINTTAEYSANGDSVANYARQFLGMKYVLGGKTPETGFDCAGFTKYVYKNFGFTLGTIASAQTTVGTDVTSMTDLKVGDLILFQNEEKTKIGHTGVYLGNGEFIHAANPDRGVVIDNLNTSTYYNTRFVIAKRIV